MNNYHFILDYETIGQDVFNAPVVNCSYYIFDWDRFTSSNPYTFEELILDIQFDKFKIKEQVAAGYKFKKRDIEWWEDEGQYAKEQITPAPLVDISVSQFVDNVVAYVKPVKINRWWSRSNTFDPILLHRNFRDFLTREDLDKILPYWKVRDVRTYIDTQFNFKNNVNGFCPIDDEAHWNKIFIKHNSIHDVAADILRLQRIDRTINMED